MERSINRQFSYASTLVGAILVNLSLCLVTLLLLSPLANAQQKSKKMVSTKRPIPVALPMFLEARGGENSVLLRWIPVDVAEFEHGQRVGYTVERAEVIRGKVGAFEKMTGSPVLPWSDDEWTSALAAGLNDTVHLRYAEFARGLLQSPAVPSTPNTGKDRENRERLEEAGTRLQLLAIAADLRREAAFGAGFAYTDLTVRRGASYLYRVTLATPLEGSLMKPGQARVTAKAFDPASRRRRVSAEERDGSVILSWASDSAVSCYYIERARDGYNDFTPLNSTPFLVLSPSPVLSSSTAYDDSVANNIPYRYRVYGMTHFADRVLIGEVVAKGRDRTPPPAPHIIDVKVSPPLGMAISWEMLSNAIGDLRGFVIERDTSEAGVFPAAHAGILPASQRSFIDNNPVDPARVFYRVRAVDTAGNARVSLATRPQVLDSIPPARPVWLRGVIDTNGVVKLELRPNNDADFMGYRIFRANDSTHEFTPFKNSYTDSMDLANKPTVFTDTVTLRTLTPCVYYRATALDGRFNQSALSEILVVRRPDIIPPVMPVIRRTTATDSNVTLVYRPSTSADVVTHVVYRKRAGEKEWMQVALHSGRDTMYVDSDIRRHVVYHYTVQAVDRAGNRSQLSPEATARPFDTGVRPRISSVTARYDSLSKRVTLRWSRPRGVSEHDVIVYRSVNGSVPRRTTVVTDQKSDSWIDADLRGVRSASYRFVLRTKDGGTSPFSDSVSVLIR